eukprot:UN04414
MLTTKAKNKTHAHTKKKQKTNKKKTTKNKKNQNIPFNSHIPPNNTSQQYNYKCSFFLSIILKKQNAYCFLFFNTCDLLMTIVASPLLLATLSSCQYITQNHK